MAIDLQPQVPVGDIAAGVGGDILLLPLPDTKPVCGLQEPRPLLGCGGCLHHDPGVASSARPLVEEPPVHEPDVEGRPGTPADVELEDLRESRCGAHTHGYTSSRAKYPATKNPRQQSQATSALPGAVAIQDEDGKEAPG